MLQVHADIDDLPDGACEFVGHAKLVDSVVAETDAEYVPTPQSVQ